VVVVWFVVVPLSEAATATAATAVPMAISVPVDMPAMELLPRKPPDEVLAAAPVSEAVLEAEPAWADAELLPAVALVAAS